MKWILEFLIGAAFWFGVIYYLSEIAQIKPGSEPPVIAFGVLFAIAFGRAMLYLQRPDRNMLVFALVHLAGAVVGFGVGLSLFPPQGLQG